MSRQGGAEKRRHPRVRARNVAAHVRFGEEGTACLLEDLSQGGLFLRTERPLAPDVAVVLTLMKPGLKKGLQLSGRVARVITADEARARHIAAGVGITFDPLPPPAAQALAELIRELAPVSDPPTPLPGDERPRLMLQINGLMLELSEREREVDALKEQLRQALVAVSERDAKIIQLTAERDKLRKHLATPPTLPVVRKP